MVKIKSCAPISAKLFHAAALELIMRKGIGHAYSTEHPMSAPGEWTWWEAKPKLNFHILMVYLQSLKGLTDELYDGVNQRDGPLVQFFYLSVMTAVKLNVTSVA